ncbi:MULTISPECIES: hypothetical protein [Pseudomonas syringae group]|uniref:hypothetical protein n=1 Tax=Pseudomonas syringae group TaxID=136849 RepID=UPI000E31568F|nr:MULTISPECIES: hypothetical protein [Pseudomonas syringae group]
MSEPTPEATTVMMAHALINTLKIAGWTLKAVCNYSHDRHPVQTAEELEPLLECFDVCILEFSHATASEMLNRVRFDNFAEPKDQVYGWAETGDLGFAALLEGFVAGIPALLLQREPDIGLDALQLSTKYSAAGEHGLYTKEDWRYEVLNCDTLQGYWNWAASKIECAQS